MKELSKEEKRFSYMTHMMNMKVIPSLPEHIDSVAGVANFGKFLGKQYTFDDVWSGYCNSNWLDPNRFESISANAEAYEKCRTVFACSLPSLVGESFSSKDSNDFFQQIPHFLSIHLGHFEEEVNWNVALKPSKLEPEEFPLSKYGVLHTCVPFGLERVSKTKTCIELYGEITSIDGKVFPSSQERMWYLDDNYYERFRAVHRPVLPVPFEIVIKRATWTNVYAPFIGIPPYM